MKIPGVYNEKIKLLLIEILTGLTVRFLLYPPFCQKILKDFLIHPEFNVM